MNKLFGLFLVLILAASSVVAGAEKFCNDSDGAIDVWTAGFTTTEKGINFDDCDGASENLKEFYCDDDKDKLDNIKCTDFNALCVEDEGGDYCGCADGYYFDNKAGMCVEEVVPEFGVVAAGVALIGGLAIFIIRRR